MPQWPIPLQKHSFPTDFSISLWEWQATEVCFAIIIKRHMPVSIPVPASTTAGLAKPQTTVRVFIFNPQLRHLFVMWEFGHKAATQTPCLQLILGNISGKHNKRDCASKTISTYFDSLISLSFQNTMPAHRCSTDVIDKTVTYIDKKVLHDWTKSQPYQASILVHSILEIIWKICNHNGSAPDSLLGPNPSADIHTSENQMAWRKLQSTMTSDTGWKLP